MASSKIIGFYWGEEKITLVEFERNAPFQVVFSPLDSKTSTLSPFSSNLTEEIQITAILQKMLQDNNIAGNSFYVSLPMKEIILRSFVIPFVKPDEMQSVIKFEAKKYMPFDIQDLSFVFHTIPFMDGQVKRLQVIFFAARKEVLARYDRIFKQVNAQVSYCEPYMVSLTKALLFRKEITPTDHIAFLILDKNLGRICFIDKGIPQFIREFAISSGSQTEETNDPGESLNLKIVNEVGNSFDFYARQFSGERIERMMVLSDFVQKDLLGLLEVDLKVKITKFSPTVTTGNGRPSNDIEAIYAMGACVASPMKSLSEFNFLVSMAPKAGPDNSFVPSLKSFKEVIFMLLVCAVLLVSTYIFFQLQLKVVQKQYDQLSAQGGASAYETMDAIQAETQQNTDMLAKFKSIRTKSDMVFIFMKVASHLPPGSLLSDLKIGYIGEDSDTNNAQVLIDMTGTVFKDDPNEEIAAVNQIFSDFKNDKELAKLIKSVNLVSLNRENSNGRQITGFNIHCS